MLDSARSIDQTMIEAMQAVERNRPAIIRPYLEFGEIPAAAKALANYYQDKAIDKRLEGFSKAIAKQEKSLRLFLDFGEKVRAALGSSFAENKAKIEQRHLDNLYAWAVDLENTATERSAEGVGLLKKITKQSKILARNRPSHKKRLQELIERIADVGEKATDEVFDMALFLRALRAEYSLDKTESVYFQNGEEMKAYLKKLVV